MVTELYVLRHAHAGDSAAWTGLDADRPLSAKGERQAERLGRFLASIHFAPDAIITSPKVRAAQTAASVASHLGRSVTIDPRLGEGFDLESLEAVLRDAGDPTRPVIVGHDPDFSDIVTRLCGAAAIPMRKGALARIDVDRPLVDGLGTLRWLLPPDLLAPKG